MNKALIEKAKEKLLSQITKHGEDPWHLEVHLIEAERWAKKILAKYPEANSDVILLSVWLHDIGHYPIPTDDHAVISEKIAKQFFIDEKVDSGLAERVLHCVRSHRNRDVKPATFDAKLFAMIDSVSHFTYIPYFEMFQSGRSKDAMEKLERDYRDIVPFPEIKNEITPLYKAFKNLLIELDKIKF